jgi:succinyl-diaminopimelate desuccinylase
MVADLAIVGEPTGGVIEGGCNGTLRLVVTTAGVRAHSARSWMGQNAIHSASEVLNRLVAYQPQTVSVEGLDYREGLNAVGITGGVAGNVIPDSCAVTVNYRFAPDKTVAQAESVVREIFDGFEVTVVDSAPGAKPGLDTPFAADFARSMGVPLTAKYGWTDVARFGEWGIPALNFGPGDPSLAHADDERVEIENIRHVHKALAGWLSPPR